MSDVREHIKALDDISDRVDRIAENTHRLGRALHNEQTENAMLRETLERVEQKLRSLDADVCLDDKELTETVLPMIRAALLTTKEVV